tara:strand:+ start:235 stop:876 length:642 start_codon:yes stop_codon:yes gene_type:complete
MATHKVLADLDVDGEVQGTSLDVNGNADISGTLSVASNIVHTGDTDTNINFNTNSIRITAGNFAAVTHDATGSTIAKRVFVNGLGSTDGSVGTGDIVYFGDTESMTTGKIYHFKSDGTWEAVDASAASTCDGLLAVALGESSNDSGMLLRGTVVIANDPGAVGDVLFVSETAGQATATAPTTSGAIVRVIGYCLHATTGEIFFNPDGAFVEVS